MSKVRANYDGMVGHRGIPVPIQVGQEFDAADEIVVDLPAFFDAVPEAAPVKAAPETKAKTAKAE